MGRLREDQALEWLSGFINSEAKLPTTPQEFNLPRTAALLGLLGDPQHAYPAVVIAGTKGKGSTAAMTEAILRAAGLRVGLYTSPHLHTLRERIQIDRRLITPPALADHVAQLQPVVSALNPAFGPLSTYEVITALALHFFAAQQVDLAVLEIGLGGRDDAVNVVTPRVSAISAISYDHTQALGDTLAAIATHKAGIIKPGVPVVTVPQAPAAAQVIAARSADLAAPLLVATPEGLHDHTTGKLLDYPVAVQAATVSLRGEFQLENARLACGVAYVLAGQGLAIPPAAIARGLEGVAWPGRVETLRERPLIVADGAHNGHSAQQLMVTLRQLFHFRQFHLVLAASSDKDLAAIAAALVPHAHTVFLTRTGHPRAAALEQLHAAVAPFATGVVRATSDIAAAIAQALELAQPADLICVSGSLFAAAAAREACGVAASEA